MFADTFNKRLCNLCVLLVVCSKIQHVWSSGKAVKGKLHSIQCIEFAKSKGAHSVPPTIFLFRFRFEFAIFHYKVPLWWWRRWWWLYLGWFEFISITSWHNNMPLMSWNARKFTAFGFSIIWMIFVATFLPSIFFPRLPVCQLNWPSLFSSSWSHIMGHHFSCRAIVAPYHAYVDAIQTIRALSVFQPPRHFICLLFVTRMNICGDACVRLNAHNEEKRTHIQISKNYWDCYGSNAIKIEAICRLGS